MTLSNLTAVARADALRVELVRHRAQLRQPADDDSLGQPVAVDSPAQLADARACEPDEAALSQRIVPSPPQPQARGIVQAIRRRVLSRVGDVLAKCRLSHLGALAARS